MPFLYIFFNVTQTKKYILFVRHVHGESYAMLILHTKIYFFLNEAGCWSLGPWGQAISNFANIKIYSLVVLNFWKPWLQL